MSDQQPETLPDERELALAYTPEPVRDQMRVFLLLDQRLARIVSQTTEPMLGQMRLAWWRDMLAKPASERPQGDVVLDGIALHWAGDEAALSALVDGWERMLDEPPLSKKAALEMATGRAVPFVAVGDVGAGSDTSALTAGKRWALVDTALNTENADERAMLFDLARELPRSTSLPSSLKGLAVLNALARRSLDKAGRPLMEGRGAALVAIRAAIFGR